MPRNNREICEGAIYHITQRGNNRAYIFQNPKSKSFLLKWIKECNKKNDFQLLAYAIMDNHYHLLIKTNKDPIDSIMFDINNVLAKFLNRELKRTGHVFEGRYNSELVDTDAYLIWVLRYIHRNPVRAHICSNVDDYRWSSHFFYKRCLNSFVNTNFILKIISSNKVMALKKYLELMDYAQSNDDPKADYLDFKNKYNLSENYLTKVEEDINRYKIKSFEEIIKLIGIDYKMFELIKSGSKKRELTELKVQFIKIAIQNKYTLKEISEFLNISISALSLLMKKYR